MTAPHVRSAVIAEEFRDLRSHGRHDRRVEERVEPGEQERADDDRDENLHAGVDVTLAAGVCERGFGTGGDGGELVLDGIDDLLRSCKIYCVNSQSMVQ